jgi:hypothetical protein
VIAPWSRGLYSEVRTIGLSCVTFKMKVENPLGALVDAEAQRSGDI